MTTDEQRDTHTATVILGELLFGLGIDDRTIGSVREPMTKAREQIVDALGRARAH